MNRFVLPVLAIALPLASVEAQSDAIVKMSEVTVDTPRIANQDPAGTFQMPISALRFDPRADVQARNLAEGQADVSIRGGVFENTGFKIGASNLYDPQTGHYFAEIPVAPNFLYAPVVLTGVDNSIASFNADVGTVAYSWRPVTNTGLIAVSGGEHHTDRQELYKGWSIPVDGGQSRLGFDFEYARSESDGTVPYGDHHFNRVNGRLQLTSAAGQTDLFAGYQGKFFGWPNLYTPFGVDETEDLQTTLVMLNHRKNYGEGDYIQAGAFWRRNRDDYEFNRFIPGLYNPYKHSTWVKGLSADGHASLNSDGLSLSYGASMMADSLESTSLIYGKFMSRDYVKATLVPEQHWKMDDGNDLVVKAGGSYDDTNRDASAFSPVAEISTLTKLAGKGIRKIYLSYSQASQVATYTALNSNPNGGLFRGNPNLGRTKSDNLELGVTEPLAGEWKATAAVFWREDRDLVDWTYSYASTAARTANAVNVDTTGFEAFLSRSWKHLDFSFGYTALTKDDRYKSSLVDASFYALNYPKHRVTAAIVAKLGHGLEIHMDNDARIQQSNILRTGPSDAIISSLGLSFRPASLQALQLNALVDNLWDSKFQEVPAVPASRRLFILGAAYNF